MTKEELESKVSDLVFDFPEMTRSTAHAIACEHYSTEELLEMKRQLGLSQEEFIETVQFIEQRGGLERNMLGDNQKPVDASEDGGR